ncbi:MAG: DUF3050 domain-containing protein, partial [Novosphingobium sp.]|nr:DUF3050 domain-containing protein [Novosphingobium sp.]
ARAGAPEASRAFVLATMDLVHQGQPHAIAAAFTLGREQLIPAMFRQVVDRTGDPRLMWFLRYLERHVEVDGDAHGPASADLLRWLCGGQAQRWTEVIDVGRAALQARAELWTAIENEILLYGDDRNVGIRGG